MRDVFRFFSLHSYTIQRNDVLALVVEFMVCFPSMDFVGSGLAEGMLLTHFPVTISYLNFAKTKITNFEQDIDRHKDNNVNQTTF